MTITNETNPPKVATAYASDFLTENFMPYSSHVITDRALPQIDGLKPSQRRVLYTMYLMGLSKGARKKSQNIVGSTMILHPHGDATIYQTLVRLTKDNESLLFPFIDSKGNFGKSYLRDIQYASARYTEARLLPFGAELLEGIEKNAVPMVDNYDNTTKEPLLLPVKYPTILMNHQEGMAVGMASSIPSYNFNELVDYLIAYMGDETVNIHEYIFAPDFVTPGEIVSNQADIQKVIETGKGSIKLRANVKTHGNVIHFTSIPSGTTLEAIMDKISELAKQGKVKEILEMNDITGINSTGIELIVKNNTNKEQLIERLYQMTPLESSVSFNCNLIINGSPLVLGVTDTLRHWLHFRIETIQRMSQYEKEEKEKSKHLLEAFPFIENRLDEVIAIIQQTPKPSEVISELQVTFGLDKIQAEAIAELKLRHLNRVTIEKKKQEMIQVEKEIERLQTLLTDEQAVKEVIKKQLIEGKEKYGSNRRTTIGKPKERIKEEVFIENYNVQMVITKEGYVKKIPLTSLRGQTEQKIKDGDMITQTIMTTNEAELLFFTSNQNVYKVKAHTLVNHKPSVLGDYLPNILSLEEGETVLHMVATVDFDKELLIGYADGKMARLPLSVYQTKLNRSVLKNAMANKQAIFFYELEPNTHVDIFSVTKSGKAILLNSEVIPVKTTKNTIGVTFQKVKENDTVASYEVIAEEETATHQENYRVANAGIGKKWTPTN